MLPIDERDELQELVGDGSNGQPSISVTSKAGRSARGEFAPLAETDCEEDLADQVSNSGSTSGTPSSTESEEDESGSDDSDNGSPSRRTSSAALIDLPSRAMKPNGGLSNGGSFVSNTLKKAKNFMSKGKWSVY